MSKTLRLLPLFLVVAAPAAAQSRGHLHQRHRADSPEVLSELPSARADGADVADDLSGRAAVGALDQAARHRARRCRRGASIRTSASRASRTIRRCATTRSQTIAKWVDAGAPMGNAADMPKPREFDDADRWHIGKPDRDRHLAEARRPGRSRRLVGQLLRRRPASPRIATSRRSRASRARPPSSITCSPTPSTPT